MVPGWGDCWVSTASPDAKMRAAAAIPLMILPMIRFMCFLVLFPLSSPGKRKGADSRTFFRGTAKRPYKKHTSRADCSARSCGPCVGKLAVSGRDRSKSYLKMVCGVVSYAFGLGQLFSCPALFAKASAPRTVRREIHIAVNALRAIGLPHSGQLCYELRNGGVARHQKPGPRRLHGCG